MTQPNPRTLGAEELILSHFSLAPMRDIHEWAELAAMHQVKLVGGQNLAPHIAALANGMRKFLSGENLCMN